MRTICSNKRGAALVEFAIAAMLLFTLVFGIIEFSLLMKDYLTISQAAREGARAAALRGDTTHVEQRVRASAPGFSTEQSSQITVTAFYRTYDSNSGWSDWLEGLPPADAENLEAQVKVEATYPHHTTTGSLFGIGEVVTLSGKMVMHRE